MENVIKKAPYLKPTSFLFVLFTLLFSLLLVLSCEAKVLVVGELIREMTVQVGQTYKGIILLKNDGEKTREVKLYQTDYLFFSDGTNIYGEPPGKLERSNANWLIFSPTWVEIPPGQTVSISYTLKVPNDDSLVGTYWSMLMIEPLGEMEDLALTKELSEGEQTNVSVRQVIRYGMQFVTHIGDSGTRDLKLDWKMEGRALQLDLENIGQRWLRPEIRVELYNKEGLLIGRFESKSGKMCIYPGTSVRHIIDLSDLPKGKYKWVAVLTDLENGYMWIYGV